MISGRNNLVFIFPGQVFYQRRASKSVTRNSIAFILIKGGESCLFKSRSYLIRPFLMSAMLALLVLTVQAQDPLEIHMYEYEFVPTGMWNLETHINYIGKGTKSFEGPVAPTNNQFHLTYELTRGITDHFETAGYLVLAHRPGGGYEYVGWRIRARVRLPQSWGLPVDVSLSGEVGFPREQYEENSLPVESLPTNEKTVGRFQVGSTPVTGRALLGLGTEEAWDFEPIVRM